MCGVRETALFTGEDLFIPCTEPLGPSARFLIDLTTKVVGSEEESDERPSM